MDKKNGLTFPKMLFKGAFVYNPVLTQAIGICSIVAICFTLKISFIISLSLALVLIINEILASLFLKKLARWLRITCYMLISTIILLPIMLIFEESFSHLNASIGIYLPLLAANSIIVIRCEKYAVKNSVKHSLFDALSASLGFGVVTIIVGGLREIIAYGTLLGKHIINGHTYSGIALPFGGLIVLGFLAAFHKWIIRNYFKEQPTNTFPLKTVFDTPSLHEAGLNVTDGSLKVFVRKDSAKPERKSNITQETESTSEKTEVEGTTQEVEKIISYDFPIEESDETVSYEFSIDEKDTKVQAKEEEEK